MVKASPWQLNRWPRAFPNYQGFCFRFNGLCAAAGWDFSCFLSIALAGLGLNILPFSFFGVLLQGRLLSDFSDLRSCGAWSGESLGGACRAFSWRGGAPRGFT